MKERWKSISGYRDLYKISDQGRIKSFYKKERILNPCPNTGGYMSIILIKYGMRKTYTIHRLVARTFLKNCEHKPYINHKDGNKLNNTLNNLEWCTASENLKHSYTLDLKSMKGEKNSQSKLSEIDVLQIRKLYKNSGLTKTQIGKIFTVSTMTICDILSNRTWNHLCKS